MHTTAFHARFQTDVDNEIEFGSELYIAGVMRYGERLSRLVRRDPATIWRRFRYFRADLEPATPEPGECGRPFAIVHRGIDIGDDGKASAADILTPDNAVVWRDFIERLAAELNTPDARWRFAPAARCHCGMSGLEFWPLASAELLREMGFAVAETLATFVTFHGFRDEQIRDHVEGIWWNVSPAGGRSTRRRNLLEGE
jgi:AcrR family transcriptional regulator